MKLINLFIVSALCLFSTAYAQSTRVAKIKMVRGTSNPAVAEVSTVQTVADVAGALGGKYFRIYSAGDAANYAVWIDVDNGSTAPVVSGATLVEVDIAADATADAVASAIQVAVDALADFSASVLTDTVTITNAGKGAATNIAAGTSGFTVGVSTAGVSSTSLISASDVTVPPVSWQVCNDAVQSSTYIFVGTGIDPSLNGVSLGKGKCFVCEGCTSQVLKSLKVSSQASSAGYAVIQYRQ